MAGRSQREDCAAQGCWPCWRFIHRRLGDYQQSVTCYRRALEIGHSDADEIRAKLQPPLGQVT